MGQWNSDILKEYLAPEISAFTEAEIRDVAAAHPESAHWIANHMLNSVFGSRYDESAKPFVLNVLFRAQAAVRFYSEARDLTLSFLARKQPHNPAVSLYFPAVAAWEATILNTQIVQDVVRKMRKDVEVAFAAYGRLMAKIGGLEQFMRIALGEHEVRRMQRGGRSGPEEFQRQAHRIMKLDFGKLLHQVYTKFKLRSEVLTVLKEAKGFRDHLAHDFWVAQFGNLRSERGTAIIIEHCKLLERQFEKVADLLIAVTGLDAATYVRFVSENSSDEQVFRDWEVRLEAARDAEAIAAEATHSQLGKDAPA